jgi:hypothetical protein
MLNSTVPLWPLTAANHGQPNSEADPWGMGAAIETQARLWNHLLDANRSFWSFYTPWLQLGSPWLWGMAGVQQDEDEEGMEPATTADGLPDPLELQARSWNRFLDASRSFWSAVSWPVPTTPWVTPADEVAPEPAPAREDHGSKVTPLPRSATRKPKSPKSRAA